MIVATAPPGCAGEKCFDETLGLSRRTVDAARLHRGVGVIHHQGELVGEDSPVRFVTGMSVVCTAPASLSIIATSLGRAPFVELQGDSLRQSETWPGRGVEKGAHLPGIGTRRLRPQEPGCAPLGEGAC